MGIAYGQIWYLVLTDPNYIGKTVDPALQRKFMCIGCCAIISPYVRLKYSVSVILLEIFQDWELTLPMFWTAIVANHVAD